MANRKKVTYQALGLFTAPNQLSAPDGAMDVARNVEIRNQGVITNSERFQGAGLITPTEGTATGFYSPFQTLPGRKIFMQACRFVAATDVVSSGNFKLYGYDIALGTQTNVVFTKPDGTANTPLNPIIDSGFYANGNDYVLSGPRGSFIGDANGNLGDSGNTYRIGASGVTRWDGAGVAEALTPFYYTSTAAPAGANDNNHGIGGLPAPATTTVITATSNANGAAGGQVAYRVLYATKDPQNNLIRGAPSGRMVVYSASAALTYGIAIPLKKGGVYAGDILQLYRSETAYAGTGFTAEPSDELRQCYEYIVQSADVTAGYVAIANDLSSTSPPSGPALYTNASQDGILASKMRPPACSSACFYKGTAFYGAVTDKLRTLVVSILGTTGWSTGGGTETSLSIGGVTIKASTFEDLPNAKFHLDTTSATVSQQLFNTARSIARTISWSNSANYAVFASSSNDFTPSIIFKTFITCDSASSDVNLAFTNTPAGTISPSFGSGTSGSLGLITDAKPERIYFSDLNEPESVPDLNYLSVGVPGVPVLAVVPLRDSVFVFKYDGLYRITGSSSADFRVELFDATINTPSGMQRAPAKCGNFIFSFCTNGVVQISESGSEVISAVIDDIVGPWKFMLGDASVLPVSATGSDFDRGYYLLLNGSFYVGPVQYPGTSRFLKFNTQTRTWCEIDYPSTGNGFCSGIFKIFSPVYIPLQTGRQSGYIAANTTFSLFSQESSSYQFTSAPSFSYCVEDMEDPTNLVRFNDVTLNLNGSVFPGDMTATFTSDAGAPAVTVTQTPITTAIGIDLVRFQVPREHSYCGQLNVLISGPSSGTLFQCNACVISYDMVSDRVARQ